MPQLDRNWALQSRLDLAMRMRLRATSARLEQTLHTVASIPYGWTPYLVTVTIREKRDYNRLLLYSDYTTITGWGGPSKVFLTQPYTIT